MAQEIRNNVLFYQHLCCHDYNTVLKEINCLPNQGEYKNVMLTSKSSVLPLMITRTGTALVAQYKCHLALLRTP